ncbi:MAG: citrate transporter [Oscillospiraceae bacterium]|nr:citrate transporter [Oscillospiraceae bacterium]MBQ2795308.1 citrate transporter [Oscillospiraceae bacterium]MBQ2861349.1 citrate transporter [Oscillospiraceae bacterium]MBQ6802558.1 citrate transporter [Oscillospiraceae bacterium]
MKVVSFIKRNTVFCVAAFAALLTCFFVPPDAEYLSYFDWRTLACLFITLAVVCALGNVKFFTILARKLVMVAGNLRGLFLMLVVITFIGSMIIANDMALITFLPLGYFALSVGKKEKYMAYLFILQNISANLGGMLTPFGNPQNLYLYSFFEIPTDEFVSIMFPPFLLAIAMLALACFLVKPEKLHIDEEFPEKFHTKKTLLYFALFFLSVLIVLRVMPFWVGLLIIPAVLFFVDKDALLEVDYGLLGTFFFFFVFSGNLARIDAVNEFFSMLLEKDALIVSTLSCQFISNVPSAILLSQFTNDYHSLLLGVNIGGTGTLIASLASLITFSEFRILYPEESKKYLGMFTVINVIFLVVMTAAAKIFFI